MAETLTPNYSWTKPDPGASANTWGATLNKDLDGIDAQVAANQSAGVQGAVPVGAVTMFAGATPPTNWLMCDGSSLSTTTYAKLFAVVGYGFGGSGANFNLPNLQGRFPVAVGAGYALGQTGGEATHQLVNGELPSHAHPITDVTHNHTINQTAHNHTDPSHTHGVSDPSHSHTVASVALGSGTNIQPGSGFNQTGTLSTSASYTGISIQYAGTGIQAANANVSLNASGTGLSTTQNNGGGAAHNNLPPFLSIPFIIKFQ